MPGRLVVTAPPFSALLVAALVAAWALSALGCEPDPRNDAVLFLDRVARIDADDPIEERRRMIESLASLPLAAERVDQARDACVEGHEKMLAAEELQQDVASHLARYEASDVLPADERQQLDSQLDRARTLIRQAGPLISRCHRMTADLELRYRPRRRGEESP